MNNPPHFVVNFTVFSFTVIIKAFTPLRSPPESVKFTGNNGELSVLIFTVRTRNIRCI